MPENTTRPTTGTIDHAAIARDGNGEQREDDVDNSNPSPADAMLDAQTEDWFALAQLLTDGKLDQYRGEFVFYAKGTIFEHGRSLVDHVPVAEAKAAAAGIAPERLVYFFVPGSV